MIHILLSSLTESQRDKIIGIYKNNVPNHNITRIIGVHRTTVARTIKKYLDDKDFVTKNRSGRPKLINNENKKTLKNIETEFKIIKIKFNNVYKYENISINQVNVK